MTPLQYKINIVEQYILEMKGKSIKIKFEGNNHEVQLEMLEQCYHFASRHYGIN
jgi:hypothetical protein